MNELSVLSSFACGSSLWTELAVHASMVHEVESSMPLMVRHMKLSLPCRCEAGGNKQVSLFCKFIARWALDRRKNWRHQTNKKQKHETTTEPRTMPNALVVRILAT